MMMKASLAACAVGAVTMLTGTTAAYAADFRCVAVAKRAYGEGPRIRGTRAVGFSSFRRFAPRFVKRKKRRAACRRALRKCNAKRRYSFRAGPFARCRVVRRGRV